jgi:serine palmitoyltransferase
MPAMLAVSSIEALKIIDDETPKLMDQLFENVALFRSIISKNLGGMSMYGAAESPLVHLRLKAAFNKREEEEKVLQEIVDYCSREGVLFTRAKYCVSQELHAPKPSIRVTMTAGLTKKEVEKSANILKDAIKKIVK